MTRFYLHDNAGRLLEEHDDSGTVVARYVYGMGLISREEVPGGAVSIYHYDSLGSTVALTDISGAITDKYAYDPYGRIVGQEGATPNPFTYNGRDGVVYDGNSLYFMRTRYYAPELKRFIQRDEAFKGSLDRTQSLNRYAFVEGNPIHFTDPRGEIAPLLIGAVAGVAFQFAFDAVNVAFFGGEWSSPRDYAIAAIGGAIGGGVSFKIFTKVRHAAKALKGLKTSFKVLSKQFLTSFIVVAPIAKYILQKIVPENWDVEWSEGIKEKQKEVVDYVQEKGLALAEKTVDILGEEKAEKLADFGEKVYDTGVVVYDKGNNLLNRAGKATKSLVKKLKFW